MFKKIFLSSTCLFALGSFAHADTIKEVYNLANGPAFTNVSNATPAGTITLFQDSSKPGEVDVTVDLNSNFSFRISPGSHTGFAFNLGTLGLGTVSVVDPVTTHTTLTTGFALQGGGVPLFGSAGYPNSPYGPDEYGIECSAPTCAKGPVQGDINNVEKLSFHLFATGLTDDSFTDFAADLIQFNSDGKGGTATGSITTGGLVSKTYGGDPSPVPEPSSLVLLGSGLVGAAGMARRKMLKK